MDQLFSAAEIEIERRFRPHEESVERVLGAELDALAQRFVAGDVIAGMRDLRDVLLDARSKATPEHWLTLAAETVMCHPIAEIAHGCPVTRLSFEKLRGYPGDAPLLDQIYGIGDNLATPNPATVAGQVHFFVFHSMACRAVRRRREIIAAEIANSIAQSHEGPAILSVACGHLREIELVRASDTAHIGAFHALDQDPLSLAEIDRKYGAIGGLKTIEGSVKSIIRRRTKFENLDFVYSAGLFDYLAPPIAMRLIERMFEFLRPGGRLLVANFTPAVEDIGYMETFMDWRLIYRTRDELNQLFSGLPQDAIIGQRSFEDESGAVAFVEVKRK
jgi:SAM-dependent methyltransferase